MKAFIGQIVRFGLVGIGVTFVHVSAFTLLVMQGLASPQQANFVAFLGASIVSFYCHFIWTFQCSQAIQKCEKAWMFGRFLVVALIGLGLNSFWVYFVTAVLAVHYYYANILFIFITPLVLFVLNKLLVFNEKSNTSKDTL